MNISKSIVGKNIKILCLLFNISQKELAEKINSTDSIMSKYMSGLNNPSLENANNISKFFGIHIETLLIEDSFDFVDQVKKDISR